MPPTKGLLLFTLCLGFSASLTAQDNPCARVSTPASASSHVSSKTEAPPHRFWDRENDWLFAGVTGARMLDYASTRHFRNQGNNEWLLTNSIVDNKPLFVGIELAGAAVSVGVSYLCHRTGHHHAERWVSIVHIGVAVGGSFHNYALKPPASLVVPAMAIQSGGALVSARVQ
jgi:hypothetical protein